MTKSQDTLSPKEREELMPLLHITKAEAELMPEDILKKLDILRKEQINKDDFLEIEAIIDESLSRVESLKKTHQKLKPRLIKEQLWWSVHYKIFLSQRKNNRARRKNH